MFSYTASDVILEDVARMMNTLAIGLGFESGYVAQGGDIGSRVARMMGVEYPSCKGGLTLFFFLKRKN